MWEPSQATLDKDINSHVLLASAGCRLFGELKHRETAYVLCGGKGTAPGCALHGSPKVPSGDTTDMHAGPTPDDLQLLQRVPNNVLLLQKLCMLTIY